MVQTHEQEEQEKVLDCKTGSGLTWKDPGKKNMLKCNCKVNCSKRFQRINQARFLNNGEDDGKFEISRNTANEQSRSLFGLVGAAPAPKPATPAASAKTSASGSHRLPPIHGSIFGKRSLAGNGMPSASDDLDDMDLAAFLDMLDEQQDRDNKIIKRSNHRLTWK